MRRHRNGLLLLISLFLLVFSAAPAAAQDGGQDLSDAETPGGEDPSPGLYDCNPDHVLCDGIEPECIRAGTVPSVVDGCWGNCVEFTSCQPIACADDSSHCPSQAYCHAAGFCAMDEGCTLLDYPPSCEQEPWFWLWMSTLR